MAVLALSGIAAQAGPISAEKALAEARQFCQKRQADGRMRAMALDRMKVAYTAPGGYYVVNRGSGNGYVIVAADDCSPAVLGCVYDGDFDYASLPDNMRAWLDTYAGQVALMAKTGVKYEADESKKDHEPVDSLISTLWGQVEPYNELCPMDTRMDERSVTGCVATALAMLVRYHKYPARPTGTPNAYVESFDVPAPAITWGEKDYDWDNMLDRYAADADAEGAGTQEQRAAVALLMRDMGYSVDMRYTSRGSGSYEIKAATAMTEHLGYDKACHMEMAAWYTPEEWDSMLYKELSENGPVLYTAADERFGAHAFVCTGYKGDGYYWFNWGWNGRANGEFLLSALNPRRKNDSGVWEQFEYTSNHFMLTGVRRPQQGSDYVYRVAQLDPLFFELNSASTRLLNVSNVPLTADLGYQMKNMKTGEISYHTVQENKRLEVGVRVEVGLPLPTLADGYYEARLVYKREGGEWALCTAPGQSHFYILAEDGIGAVSDGTEFEYVAHTVSSVSLVQNTAGKIDVTVEGNDGGAHIGSFYCEITDVTGGGKVIYTSKTVKVAVDRNYPKQLLAFEYPAMTYDASHTYRVRLYDGGQLLAESDDLTVAVVTVSNFTVTEPLQVKGVTDGAGFVYRDVEECPPISIKLKNENGVPVEYFYIKLNDKYEIAFNVSSLPGVVTVSDDEVVIDGALREGDNMIDVYWKKILKTSDEVTVVFRPYGEHAVLTNPESAKVTFAVKDRPSAIEALPSGDGGVAFVEVYTPAGMLVARSGDMETLHTLQSGLYIVKMKATDGTLRTEKMQVNR